MTNTSNALRTNFKTLQQKLLKHVWKQHARPALSTRNLACNQHREIEGCQIVDLFWGQCQKLPFRWWILKSSWDSHGDRKSKSAHANVHFGREWLSASLGSYKSINIYIKWWQLLVIAGNCYQASRFTAEIMCVCVCQVPTAQWRVASRFRVLTCQLGDHGGADLLSIAAYTQPLADGMIGVMVNPGYKWFMMV